MKRSTPAWSTPRRKNKVESRTFVFRKTEESTGTKVKTPKKKHWNDKVYRGAVSRLHYKPQGFDFLRHYWNVSFLHNTWLPNTGTFKYTTSRSGSNRHIPLPQKFLQNSNFLTRNSPITPPPVFNPGLDYFNHRNIFLERERRRVGRVEGGSLLFGIHLFRWQTFGPSLGNGLWFGHPWN